MGKRLILILALAFVVGISFAAYAEVQNVKVSGDLTVKGITRDNDDFMKTEADPTGGTNNDQGSGLMSIARVRIDADLTDNVSTTFRLINERDWDSDANQAATEENDIDLDLAYVTMKEFLYSPLSLTIGRQELHYGNDMIVGDPDTNNIAASSLLTANDQSLRKSFDAIKAVLNYDPLIVNVIFAKISENAMGGPGNNEDADLYGINANYALNKETTVEGYFFTRDTGSNAAQFAAGARTTGIALQKLNTKGEKTHVIGGRVVNSSVKNLTTQLEAAFQFGTYNPGYDINSQPWAEMGRRKAWALEAMATYNLADVKSISKYSPSLSFMYAFFSGEKNTRDEYKGPHQSDYHGWDPMFENQEPAAIANRIFAQTNCQLWSVTGTMKPIEDVTLSLKYSDYYLNKRFPDKYGDDPIVAGFNTVNLRGLAGANTYFMTSNSHLGRELDATLLYAYTEDVQFGLLGGVFMPGAAFHETNDSAASELIGSMKVTF